MKKRNNVTPAVALTAMLLAGTLLLSACAPLTTAPHDTQGTDTSVEVADTSNPTEGDTQDGEEVDSQSPTETQVTEETPGEAEGETDPEAQTSAAGEAVTLSPAETQGAEDVTQGETAAPEPAFPTNGPTFSHAGGLYTAAISLELTAPEGYTIRYTTDGSVPTARSTTYKKPIAINVAKGEAKTIRAACFDSSKKIAGAVATHTYVMTDKVQSTLYTVMISVKDSDLDAMMDDVNAKVEKPAHVEVVTPAGETVISQDAGLRLFGGSSRALDQKSFKLIARKTGYFGTNVAYTGTGSFRYPLFPDRTIKGGIKVGSVLEKYDSFILRNGGNDALIATACNPEYATLLRDGLANNFVAKVSEHVEYSLSQFAVVYINGEYYGLLDMRENLNEDFVKRVWGVLDDDVVVIKSELDTTRACSKHDNAGGCRYCGSWFFYETGDSTLEQSTLQEWINFCKDITSKVNASDAVYNAAYKKLEANVDLQGLMEWYAINLYLCNTDWPHNNIKLWKYTGQPIDGIEITDGKWRFMTRDMDMTMGRYAHPDWTAELDSRPTVDSFYRTLGNYLDYSAYFSYEGEHELYNDALYLQGLLAFCLRNDAFRADFEAYCRKLISAENTTLLKNMYTDMQSQVRPGMTKHINRWKYALGDSYGLKSWLTACKSISSFTTTRPSKFEEHLNRMLAMYK